MLEGGQQLSGAPIPEPRGFVPTRRQDPRPVGTEHRGSDIALMLEGDQRSCHLPPIQNQLLEEPLRSDLVFRIEFHRSRQQGDPFIPLTEVELSFGLVEARPTRFLQQGAEFAILCLQVTLRGDCILLLLFGFHASSKSEISTDSARTWKGCRPTTHLGFGRRR